MLAQGAATVGAAGLLYGGVAYATLYPPSQICGPVLVAGGDAHELALTYDDGPNDIATMRLLELLARYEVRASFFLIGEFVRQRPELARAVVEAGHLVGNHTMTHPWLTWLPRERIDRELRETNAAIESATGVRVAYFRPPHGARRPYVLRAARDLGMTTAQWNVTAEDWKPFTTAEIVTRVARGVDRNRRRRRGSNILLHDGGHLGLGTDRTRSIEVTEEILKRYSAERFVTVDAWNYPKSGLR